MGCCLFASILAGAPRFAFVLWWLFQPGRIGRTFDGFLWPLLGLIFVPWTTLMYVMVYPGGIGGFDWLWLALALFIDLGTYGGGAKSKSRSKN
ncbi:MAG: hypothetical protein HGB10_02755 [Coriobacteriia bacterium]|nr:hypothetical protein [Coriobacteriia bacterium]